MFRTNSVVARRLPERTVMVRAAHALSSRLPSPVSFRRTTLSPRLPTETFRRLASRPSALSKVAEVTFRLYLRECRSLRSSPRFRIEA